MHFYRQLRLSYTWEVSTNEAWYETASSSGMTLDELDAWVQHAKEAGVARDARPKVTVATSGGIKKIGASGR